MQAKRLGVSVFGVTDMYDRLKDFKEKLSLSYPAGMYVLTWLIIAGFLNFEPQTKALFREA